MKRQTEVRLRKRVRNIVESILSEGVDDRKTAAEIKTACTKYISGTISYDVFKNTVTGLVKRLS
jgi:hypothetical protein